MPLLKYIARSSWLVFVGASIAAPWSFRNSKAFPVTSYPGIVHHNHNAALSQTDLGLTARNVASFETAFATISEKCSLTIIAEGVPLRQKLDDREAAALFARINVKNGATDAIISDVAQSYDYSAEKTGARAFLLRKRYSDRNDLPCVTSAEIEYSLGKVLEVIDPGPADLREPNRGAQSALLYDSLSSEQIQRAADGLKFADLSVEQKELAKAAAREVVLSIGVWQMQDVLYHLTNLKSKRTVFKWIKLKDDYAFGYEGPFGPGDRIWPFPLNNGYTSQVGGAYSRTVMVPSRRVAPDPRQSPLISSRASSKTGQDEILISDPTIPTNIDRYLAQGMLGGRLPSTVTLREFAEAISSREPFGVHVSVNDAVAGKPIEIYGEVNSSRHDLVHDVASLYGLQVRSTDNVSFSIGLNRPRPIDRPEDAAAEISRMIPPPILRYAEGQTTRIAKELPQKQIPDDQPLEAQKFLKEAALRANVALASLGAARACYFPAIRRLLVLALPFVPTQDSSPVQALSVSPEVERLIALSMLSSGGMYQWTHLDRFTPSVSLSDPDRMVIRLRALPRSTFQILTSAFGYRDDAGTFHQEGINSISRDAPEPIQ